ncbi:MAG: putative metal-binding motif-containing protein, partial [Myxococcales bacterium]|nr:putative metal-binding motif-containing protein [Myxococcales bacterium]
MVLLALLGVATIGCGGSEGPGPADAGATDAGATDAGAADATRCATSADCDDGIFCNGDERCDPSSPGADLLGCAPAAGEACMFAQICDEGMAACLTQCEAEPDADGDGHRAESCGGMDCDDADAERYPGNTEVCDAEGHDEDCDPSTYGPDADADGFVGAACCNTSADGSLLCGADCDDSSGDIRPTAPESCNGVDDNCDGLIDEGVLSTFYPDCDGDGFGALGAAPVMACVAPTSPSSACAGAMRAAWAGGATDCADGAESVHPGAAEICNGFDDDCDDAIDEGAGTPFHPDCDSDGYGAQGSIPTVACAAPAEPPPACPAGAWSDLPTDCDDAYGAVHPMAAELCNALDEDCDGAIDGPAAAIWCTLENVETETCVLGVCGVARCTSGWADCDGAAPNGCEIDLLNDPAHCGGCALPCALTNGSPACSGGSCVVGSCDAGFHECSSACVSDLALATCGIGCDP